MLKAFLDSITKPEELQALLKYKFAPKSASAVGLQQTLAQDTSKKSCYDFLNLVKNIFMHVIPALFNLFQLRLLEALLQSFKNWMKN